MKYKQNTIYDVLNAIISLSKILSYLFSKVKEKMSFILNLKNYFFEISPE